MGETLNIGCHLSSSKGYLFMGKQMMSMGGNTFQFFTRNPRGSKAKAIDPEDAAALCRLMEQEGFAKILAHAPYTLNPASADPKVRTFALMTIQDDLERMEYTPGQMYNFHPGSHVGQGMEEGIRLISELLNEVLKPEQTTTVLLETMAGKGSEVGGRFEELAEILRRVELSDHMGVCLDTCHVHDGGYDIVNDLDGVLEEFDRIVGLDRLKAIHINDSKNPLASHKDRHEVIGGGFIGLPAFERIINHPRLRRLPFYLETPNEIAGYTAEIALLKSRYRSDETSHAIEP
ncbi:MAG: deoxyribonuclease IV [Firmicutes bacterium]|nr:deoxyribonuclease IV [Bacillota bacterium]